MNLKKDSKELLEKFFGMSTWDKPEFNYSDRGRFLDFIAEAYKNGDKNLNYDDFLAFAQTFLKKDISEHQRSQLGMLESLYLNGIEIIERYNQISK